jgi:hypothetical protein
MPASFHPAPALWLLPVLAAAPAHAKVTVALPSPASKLKPGRTIPPVEVRFPSARSEDRVTLDDRNFCLIL